MSLACFLFKKLIIENDCEKAVAKQKKPFHKIFVFIPCSTFVMHNQIFKAVGEWVWVEWAGRGVRVGLHVV